MSAGPGAEAEASQQGSSGSLLSPEAMGGLRGGKGFDAERDYILARLHIWQSQPGFEAIQIEGLTEVELAFIEENSRWLEYIQVKDHPVGLPEGREILNDFYDREQSSSGPQYRKYTLACDNLIGKMNRIYQAIERYRQPVIYTPVEKAPTVEETNRLLTKLGIQSPAQFLIDKVYFDIDGDWLKSEELRRNLFITRFVTLPNYRLDASGACRIYAQLIAQIELSRGKTIQRDQIEEIVRVEQFPLSASDISLDHEKIVAYAESLQSWATVYQEDIIGWGGVYIPLRAQSLPIHVGHLLGLRNQLEGGTPQDVLEAVRTHRKLILVGDPGSGKTTVALKVAYDLAERLKSEISSPIPVVILLRDLTPRSDLTTLIQDSLARHGLNLEPEEVEQLILSSDRLYLILEGMNEIGKAAREAEMPRDIARVVHTLKGGALVTTRREGYDPQLFQEVSAVEVLRLSQIGIADFLHGHFPEVAEPLIAELQSDPENENRPNPLLDLARNPFLLIMLATVYHPDDPKLPSNMGELLETFTGYIIRRESQKGSQYLPETRVAVLERVAVDMLRIGRRVSLERPSMEAVIAKALDELKRSHYAPPQATVGDVLREIDQRVFRFLRSPLDKRTVEWEHHLFQEYYAASWLRRTLNTTDPQVYQTMPEETTSPEWLEPLCMLVGILKDDQVIELIKSFLDLDPLLGAEVFAAASPMVQSELERGLLDALERLLKNEDPEIRQESVRALGRLGRISAPVLFPLLGDGDYRVRYEAAQSLNRVSLGSFDELDLLDRRQTRQQLKRRDGFIENACNDSNPIVVRWSIWLLAEMLRLKSLPEKMRVGTQQALEAALVSQDPRTKLAASRALSRYGSQGLAALAELVLTEKGEIGKEARTAFDEILPSRCIGILIDFATAHSDSFIQSCAQRSLADYDMKAVQEATLKALGRALREENHRAIQGLISALGFIGGTLAVKRLIHLLDPSQPKLCAVAAVALGHTGDPEAIAPLIALLQQQDLPPKQQQIVWQSAAEGLMLLGEAALSAVSGFAQRELAEPSLIPLVLDILANARIRGVQSLLSLLEHEQSQMRAEAARRLGWLQAKQATEVLVSLLADPNADVRAAAIGALYAIDGDQSVPNILPLLDDPSAIVRQESAQALMNEYKQENVLRTLVTHLGDPDVIPYAQRALRTAGEMGIPLLLAQLAQPMNKTAVRQLLVETGPICVGPLKAILDDPPDPRRSEVPGILTEIIGPEATPLIRPLLQDPSLEVRTAALEELINVSPPELEDIIVEAMNDSAAAIRWRAVREAHLYATSPVAQTLVNLLTDRDARVQEATKASLKETGHLAVDELIALATGRKSQADRNAARDVLLSLDTRILPDLVDILQTTLRPRVVSLVGDILFQLRDPAFRALVPLLDSEQRETRRRAENILSRDKARAVSAIVEHLRKRPEPSAGLRYFLRSLGLDVTHPLIYKLARLEKKDTVGKTVIRRLLTQLVRENKSHNFLEIMVASSEKTVRLELFGILQETGHLNIQRLEQIALSFRPPQRNRALEALGWVGTPETLAIVAEAMVPSRPVGIRRTACRVLAEARSVVYLPTLLIALHDPDRDVRRLAVWGLKHFKDIKVVEALSKAANDPASSVRMEVMRALEQIGYPNAFEVIRDHMHYDEDPNVACAAARALGKIAHPEAPSALLKVCFGDTAEPLRLAAANALSYKETSTLESLLPQHVGDSDDITDLDFKLMEQIGPAATMALLPTLEHPSEEIRRRGLSALGTIGDPRAQQAVIAFTRENLETSGPWEVLVAACKTLSSVGDEQALPILNQLQQERWRWRYGHRIVEAAAIAKDRINKRLQRRAL